MESSPYRHFSCYAETLGNWPVTAKTPEEAAVEYARGIFRLDGRIARRVNVDGRWYDLDVAIDFSVRRDA